MSDAPLYEPPRDLVAKAMRRWARVSTRAVAKVERRPGVVSFSFDDFPRTAGDIGAALLEARGARGTFYVSGDLEDYENHLGRHFTRSDLNRLSATGHEIACHSFSHLDCARSALAAVERDIAANRDALEEVGLFGETRSFAYPYGETSPAVKKMLRKEFATMRGITAGVNRGRVDRSLLRANALVGADVKEALKLIASVAKRGGWAIFFTHDVRENPSPWGCTPGALKTVIDAAADAAKVEIMTVRDAERLLLEIDT